MSKNAYPPGVWDAYVRDGCVCVYCGFDGTTYAAWRQLTYDHLIPKTKKIGGEDRTQNYVVSCHACNSLKHEYDPSNGQYKCPPSDEVRQELIEKAWRIIESREKAQGSYEDFRRMMEEITKFKAKHSN